MKLTKPKLRKIIKEELLKERKPVGAGKWGNKYYKYKLAEFDLTTHPAQGIWFKIFLYTGALWKPKLHTNDGQWVYQIRWEGSITGTGSLEYDDEPRIYSGAKFFDEETAKKAGLKRWKKIKSGFKIKYSK